MYTMSAALRSAMVANVRRPYVQVKASPQIANVRRLRWTRLYTGAETDYHHAAAATATALVRFRVSQIPYDLYVNRVDNPAIGGAFSSWTQLVAGINAVAGIAAAANGNNVAVFWTDAGNTQLLWARSTDGGATFGAPAVVTAIGGQVDYLAAAYTSTSKACVVYNIGSNLYATTWNGAAWSAPINWTQAASYSAITGIAMIDDGDYNLAITATTTPAGDFGLYSLAFGQGYRVTANTFSTATAILLAAAALGTSYARPFAARPDVYRLSVVESYANATTYTRPQFSHAPSGADWISAAWKEPGPFGLNLTTPYGLAWSHTTTDVYLTGPWGVWQAPLATTAGSDFSSELLAATIDEQLHGGSAQLQIRHPRGDFATPGAGLLVDLDRGSQVAINLGYLAPTAEVAIGRTMWIEGFEYYTSETAAYLIAHLIDGWALLERWTARRQMTYSGLNIFQILVQICGRAGIEIVAGGSTSTPLTSWTPLFTIQPGESGKTAVLRLLDMVTDEIYFANGRAYIINPQPGDASAYALTGNHQIYEGHYRTESINPNRVQAFGLSVFGEAYNWTEIEAVYDRTEQIRDLTKTTGADATTRATNALTKANRQAFRDTVKIAPIPGARVIDKITLTDAKANISAQARRIAGIRTRYDRQKGITYDQTLTLNADA